jgi:glycoside/pentoside/hexuronide:cation symporter, GPH family
MYLSALPAGLGFYLMWHAPQGLPAGALLAFMIAMLIFVNVSISLYEIPSLALAPELAPDYDQRTSLLAYRWFFLIIGGAAMNFVLYQVYLRQDDANPLGVLNRDRYAEFGILASLIIVAAILISTAATHGRIRHLHVPPVRRMSLAANLREVRTALSHKPLLIMMMVGLMMGFGAGTTAGLSSYFNLHFWGLKPQEVSYMIIGALLGTFVAVWAGPALSSRFGKKPAMIALYFAWLATATVPISLRLLGLMPANGSPLLLPILVANYAFAIAFAVSCHIMLGSAIADTVDDIAVKNGLRAEGLMFAAYGLLDKFANGGGAFLAGAIVSAVAFPVRASPGTVDPEILRNMALIKLPIVIVFNLASIAFLTRYSLTRKDHEANQAALARARAAQADRALEADAAASPLVRPAE